MIPTRFWLLRHAIVTPEARAVLYGRMDVPVCPEAMAAHGPVYAGLAARLPREAEWLVTPLSRTHTTASAIAGAGYGIVAPRVEPGLTEQDLGEWQGLAHAELPARLQSPAHAFWPLGAAETPPKGESMAEVVARVGAALERVVGEGGALGPSGMREVVAVSHGGAIRAAIAHAMGASAQQVLHLSVQNLSLSVLERFENGWRVVCVNEVQPGLGA